MLQGVRDDVMWTGKTKMTRKNCAEVNEISGT